VHRSEQGFEAIPPGRSTEGRELVPSPAAEHELTGMPPRWGPSFAGRNRAP